MSKNKRGQTGAPPAQAVIEDVPRTDGELGPSDLEILEDDEGDAPLTESEQAPTAPLVPGRPAPPDCAKCDELREPCSVEHFAAAGFPAEEFGRFVADLRAQRAQEGGGGGDTSASGGGECSLAPEAGPTPPPAPPPPARQLAHGRVWVQSQPGAGAIAYHVDPGAHHEHPEGAKFEMNEHQARPLERAGLIKILR